MFNPTTPRPLGEDAAVLAERLQRLARLCSNQAGQLTEAGRALAAEGLRQGFTTYDLAELLSVSLAVVRSHARKLGPDFCGTVPATPANGDTAPDMPLRQAS
jgi:hypothetical protein